VLEFIHPVKDVPPPSAGQVDSSQNGFVPQAGSRRPDRVVNHVRLCFLAYWLSARLGGEWRARGETEEVPRVLRQLQTIRLGTLRLGQDTARTLLPEIPKNLNEQLAKLKLTALFAAPPKAEARSPTKSRMPWFYCFFLFRLQEVGLILNFELISVAICHLPSIAPRPSFPCFPLASFKFHVCTSGDQHFDFWLARGAAISRFGNAHVEHTEIARFHLFAYGQSFGNLV
jgi:hypothetical protein